MGAWSQSGGSPSLTWHLQGWLLLTGAAPWGVAALRWRTGLGGGRARSPVEEPRGGDDGSGSHGQLGFEEPHVFDFGGGYDGAEDGEQGDGPAGDGAEPFAGLPGAGEDVEGSG